MKPFSDLDLQITNGIVSTKFYNEWDNIEVEIFNFPILDGDIPHNPSYGVYILQITHFGRVYSHVANFNNKNKFVTSKKDN